MATRRGHRAFVLRADAITGVVVFLASDDARWLTGEKITASGGLR